ncbi:UV DNA damage repair endonuclease UvsE [Anaerosolibacter sp.]|uniref:UV DNA damage repair endonuclease UvsE n=1 Tax=Anaerosolibacter sp. TaxID=1872527 RepID=UPI0039EEF255
MLIRLGFVALSLLLHDASPNKTITYKSYTNLPEDPEVRLYRLQSLVRENINNTKRILIHANTHNIKIYRLTSKLIPLATHPDVISWDYAAEFHEEFHSIGNYIRDNDMRISAHPDHFTIINSPKKEVLDSSIKDLEYHGRIMDAMGLSPKIGKLVLHVGGSYDSKFKAVQRFIQNFINLPTHIRDRIILENDDKIYTAQEVLDICRQIKAPMVLDIHHHWCNNNGEHIGNLLEDIFNTWGEQSLPPKIHVSSPKCDKNIRAHADNVDVKFFYDFVSTAKEINRDFDVMIEAKNKDKALFKLIDDLRNYKNIDFVNDAAFKI